MDWFNGWAERLRQNVPLADLTWFKLGGAARYFFSPEDEEELRAVLRAAHEARVPVRVLGGGANLLVRDEGFEGLVLRLDAPAFTQVEFIATGVRAGGGVDLMELARDCAFRGRAGLECMAGIPGTVGGAIRMNAGGKFGAIAEVVERVWLMDRAGEVVELTKAELEFGYRRSAVGERIVLAADLRLTRKSPSETKARFHEIWRFKKNSQPMAAHSAGCMFKNPKGDAAGRLIEACGLKGFQLGKARVSPQHANFIVADEGATATDVLRLAEHVRDTVRAHTGIELEREVEVW